MAKTSSSIQQQLLSLAEPDYRQFSLRLLPGTSNLLGVRIPKLRLLAHRLIKDRGLKALDDLTDCSFEEIMLQGFIIAGLDLPNGDKFLLIRKHLAKMNNWSLVDSFCCSFKIGLPSADAHWNFLISLLDDSHEFTVRFALVMILNHFLKIKKSDEIFSLLRKITHQGYYVKNAIAWIVAEYCSINSSETILFLAEKTLDQFTQNRAIQKIKESRKISVDIKNRISAFRK